MCAGLHLLRIAFLILVVAADEYKHVIDLDTVLRTAATAYRVPNPSQPLDITKM